MDAPEILLEWPRPGVALVTLNRPDRLNALTHRAMRSLLAALREASDHPECLVIVITGAGRAFSAGLDIGASMARQFDHPTPIPERFDGQELFASLPRTIRTIRQPVIAAVNGAAAGAGMGITLAADIRVAAHSAVFHIAAVKLGLSAGECGISYHLPRLIGASKAYEYMLTARPIDSATADRLGLVAGVYPVGDVVDEALALAGEIASHSPFAIFQTKQVMLQNVDNNFETALAIENRAQILAINTEDSTEAMRAFLEKRSPVYTGR
ncbi:MAG: enoyl-CoA hydratase/isomerase family protein [Mycolicibacterium sp.]|nr:enoyl-CoA hydratase/isomerase family protein [Mycolicibacterium sp.]